MVTPWTLGLVTPYRDGVRGFVNVVGEVEG